MADYFTNFSFVIRLPDEAAHTYALDLDEQANRIRLEDEPAADFPAELREFLEDWCFDVEADSPAEEHGLWLHSSNGGIEAVCAFIQHLLQKFDRSGRVTFQWSHDCSRPRVDAYGGGAAIITARRVRTMSTNEWLCKHAR